MKVRAFMAGAALAVVVAACGGAPAATPAGAPTAAASAAPAPTAAPATPVATPAPAATPATTTAPGASPATPTAAPTDAPAPTPAPPAYAGPAWASLPLVDAATGETFTLADFAGKTVFVEPFATWCTNCRRQLPNVDAARKRVGEERFVFVALSVAENADRAALQAYAKENGWRFLYAAATPEVTKGLVDSFGRTVITPPSTPHFVIRPDGSLTKLATGSHDADALSAELEDAAS